MVAIFLFVHLPLTVVGAIAGRNITNEYKPPCRTNKVPREVPDVNAWFRHPAAQLFMAGFLPFSAIYIELATVMSVRHCHELKCST